MAAFLDARKHHVDLNFIYDYDPMGFMESISEFVAQIDQVDHMNLFASAIADGNVMAESAPASQREHHALQASTSTRRTKSPMLCGWKSRQPNLTSSSHRVITLYLVKSPPDLDGTRMYTKAEGT